MAGGAAITTIPSDEASANPIKGIFTAGQNIFKSAVKTSVEKLPNKGTGTQMFNTIKNNPGVKSSEMKWIGLDNFLTNNKTVTKTEIENFVKSNSIDVSEVKFSQMTEAQGKYSDELEFKINDFESKWAKIKNKDPYTLGAEPNYDVFTNVFRGKEETMDFNTLSAVLGREPKLTDMVQLPNGNLKLKHISEPSDAMIEISALDFEKYQIENQKRIFNAKRSEATGGTKFHAETEPGGKDYTELVFKIKDKDIPIETTGKRYSKTRRKDLKFTSARHMNVENEIAHVRFKTRDLNGKKVLAVEEMQSDLAIQSQKKKDAGSMAGYMKSDEYISSLL